MAAQTDDKKLDGAGLSVLWGLIKNIIPTVPTNVSAFTNDASYVSLLDTHNKNLVLASPSGAAGLPSFRALVASDIPDLSGTYLTSHQSIKSLTLQGDGTTVSTFTANSAALTFNFKAGSNISLTRGTNEITIANTYSYSHPTGGANTTIAAANGKVLSAITVNNLGHVTSVSSKTLAAADIPDLSAKYLTSHQSIYALKIQGDGTDVTTYTPNSATKTFNLKGGSNITLTRGTNEITITGTANNYGVNIKDADDIVESHYYYPALAYDYPLTNVELYTGTISFYVGQKNTSSNTCCLGIGNSSYAGEIKLSNTTTAFAKITFKGSSGTYTSELPSANGTILNTGTTSFTQSLSSGTKIGTLKINGTSTDLYCQTNTNTTYTIATGDSNGQIKVTPSSGSAYNVSVKGLGSRAFDSTAYLPLSGGRLASSADQILTLKKTSNTGVWTTYMSNNQEAIKYIVGVSAAYYYTIFYNDNGTQTNRFCISPAGNVGIGTTTPSEKLHVSGGQILVNPKEGSWAVALDGYCSSLGNGHAVAITLGKTNSKYNAGAIQYHHVGDGNSNNYLALSMYDANRLLTVNAAGNVGIGIGTDSPSYKLHVAGAVGATAFTNTSDIRNKDFISDTSMSIEQIANAPSFLFKWKTGDDRNVHAGSSAQYWQTVLPEIITAANDEQRTLSMQYDVIALLSSITIAREVVNDKERIRQLEQRVSQLEAQLAN